MSEFLNTFAARLKPNPDTADGADWALAERTLPEYITKPIPSCLFRREEVLNPEYVEEEARDPDSGKLKNIKKTVEIPVVIMEVLNVLAWVMIHKVNPVITLEEVAQGINRENRRDIINDVWLFWSGVYLWEDGEEEVIDDTENPIENPAAEKKKSPAKNSGKTSKT